MKVKKSGTFVLCRKCGFLGHGAFSATLSILGFWGTLCIRPAFTPRTATQVPPGSPGVCGKGPVTPLQGRTLGAWLRGQEVALGLPRDTGCWAAPGRGDRFPTTGGQGRARGHLLEPRSSQGPCSTKPRQQGNIPEVPWAQPLPGARIAGQATPFGSLGTRQEPAPPHSRIWTPGTLGGHPGSARPQSQSRTTSPGSPGGTDT